MPVPAIDLEISRQLMCAVLFGLFIPLSTRCLASWVRPHPLLRGKHAGLDRFTKSQASQRAVHVEFPRGNMRS